MNKQLFQKMKASWYSAIKDLSKVYVNFKNGGSRKLTNLEKQLYCWCLLMDLRWSDCPRCCCSSLLWDVAAVLTVTTQARLLFFVCLEVVSSNGRFKFFCVGQLLDRKCKARQDWFYGRRIVDWTLCQCRVRLGFDVWQQNEECQVNKATSYEYESMQFCWLGCMMKIVVKQTRLQLFAF